MIWKLLYSLKGYFFPFNVFKYITFRANYALVTTLLLSLIFGPKLIEKLKEFKASQVIRKEGPETHYKKAGTPTMGGLLIIGSSLISFLLWADLLNPYVIISIMSLILFGFIGFVDDYLKITRQDTRGIGARRKFLLQLLFAFIISVSIIFVMGPYATKLQLPFFKRYMPDIGIFYIPFAMFVIIGTSNAVNLTDGLDGLAIVPFSMCMAAYGLIAYLAGHSRFAEYLNILYIPGIGELSIVAFAFVGAGIGFLWFNAHPAEIFMGDTGSLALGALLGTVALLTKHELLLPIFGGVFVIETVSVIMQVGYYKITGGKRVFKMAPIHHHFEKEGLPESKIIVRFWIISLIFVLIGLSTLKIR